MKHKVICPICRGSRVYYAFSVGTSRMVECRDCTHIMLFPQFSKEGFEIPVATRTSQQSTPDAVRIRRYTELARRYSGKRDGRIFVAKKSGELPDEKETYDVCIIADVLNYMPDPLRYLGGVHALLKPDGVILVALPGAHDWSLGVLPHYFNRDTLHSILFHAWFHRSIGLESENEIIAIASKKPVQPHRTLSIVLPVYNEAATVSTILDALLAKDIAPLEKEIIVINNNSTDATPDILRRYAREPHIKIISERRQGKGAAVRAGFLHASGDFILIQDADLEYDLEDYEVLLEPLIAGRRAFVLGSRHAGETWKIRQFKGSPLLSWFLNLGHLFFRGLLNKLYGVYLKDPFTMYKVFRRDCLTGLTFECDRFDFDHELVVKLVRKGYIPEEIPVNYRSRSFAEGKKVSMVRDPLTWLRALIKFRFTRMDLLENIEADRK